jgi:hypothetical protein
MTEAEIERYLSLPVCFRCGYRIETGQKCWRCEALKPRNKQIEILIGLLTGRFQPKDES